MLDKDRVYHGDCLDLMQQIPTKSIDMILCDLPYGSTNCRWDSIIDLKLLWVQYKRIIKDRGAIILTAQTPFDKLLGMSNIQMLRYEWIWEKSSATGHLNSNKMPMKSHENVLVFYKKLPVYNPQKTYGHRPVNNFTKTVLSQNKTELYGTCNKELKGTRNTDRYPRSVIRFSSDKQTSCLHSTQKPVSLFEYLIKTYSNEGDIILDNAIGSGTTFIACMNTGRHCIGIEKDLKHYNTCINRVSEHRRAMDNMVRNRRAFR